MTGQEPSPNQWECLRCNNLRVEIEQKQIQDAETEIRSSRTTSYEGDTFAECVQSMTQDVVVNGWELLRVRVDSTPYMRNYTLPMGWNTRRDDVPWRIWIEYYTREQQELRRYDESLSELRREATVTGGVVRYV